ncbi:MAG TPA: dTMP kinase [Streptosporangiaceae bacterium]|nr:dTMP kinase [Streptosporangiaceae bacterium]
MNFRAGHHEDGADRGKLPDGAARRHHAREPGVLAIRPFRRLWIALSLSSLGDWLSIIALTALAPSLAGGGAVAKSTAVGGVWLATLLPALLIGPLAGALADRLDRRMTMIVGDVIRGLLFLSIPLFPNLTWIYVAKFLAGVASQFWNPATSASIPNLVPPDKLERANQLSLLTTYGTAPLAAGVFSVLALVSEGVSRVTPLCHASNVDLALYFNAASYGISALTVYFIREIPKRSASDKISVPSTAKSIWEGWRFIRQTPAVRGLVVGMVGAFAAAGVVVGLGYSYITATLHGGSAGWGLVFAATFIGMALGMGLGTKLLGDFSRRRLFGVSITAASVSLALIGLIPVLGVVVLFVVLLGALSGIAYSTGFTLVGLEVDDSTRGRVFAFFQSSIQVILLAVIAVVPFISAAFTKLIAGLNGTGNVKIGSVTYASAGQNAVILLAAVVAFLFGVRAYRQMDDRKGVPLREDLWAAIRNEPLPALVADTAHPNGTAPAGPAPGVLIAFEGGEGSGKTTQARLVAIWLRELGFDVVTTHEPGATKIGMRLRALLLDTSHTGMSAKAEALMYAADRAEHVASVITPALDRGAIVITDRYVDSSLAYQGAGRDLPLDEIARFNWWATGGRTPALTVLLDMDPIAGLSRRTRSADRLEAEPAAFHLRVRAGFRSLAEQNPGRYLVLDADRAPDGITRDIQDRVRELLPDPVPDVAEANTGAFPAIREEVLTPRRPEDAR